MGYLRDDAWTNEDGRARDKDGAITTLLRFDSVHGPYCERNERRIADYPDPCGCTREPHHYPGVADTVDMTHIKQHCFASQVQINPTRIMPNGPDIDFAAPKAATIRPAPTRRIWPIDLESQGENDDGDPTLGRPAVHSRPWPPK